MNKTIKKIVALTGAAVIVGATVGAASAATLSDYPSPFIKDGQFVGKIVIGEKASAIDVIGATDIAAALQRDASVAVKGSTTTATVSEGVRIDKTGSEFKIGQDIEDIDAVLDDNDLDMLAEETFKESKGDTDNDVTYTQTLTFVNDTGKIVYEADSEETSKPVADYLLFTTSADAYEYEVSFDTDVDYTAGEEADEFEGAKIILQGNEYTITDVTAATGLITELTLMAGDTNRWLAQGEELTVGDHKISIMTVDEEGDRCSVKVDGQVQWIDEGSDEDFGDLTVGLIDAVAVHAAGSGTAPDSCELSIGSTEILLSEADGVEVGGEEIDGTTVDFTTTSGHLSGFTVSYQPEDKVYLAKGEAFVDPVFGNFKVAYEGMVTETEDITFVATSDDATISFTAKDGKAFELPVVVVSEDYVVFGEDEDYAARINTGQAMLLKNAEVCTATSGDTNLCDGVQMLVISEDLVGHVVEVSDINWADLEVDLTDITNGNKEYTDKPADGIDIDLGFATIQLTANATAHTLTATLINERSNNLNMETEGAAYVELTDVASNSTADTLNVTLHEDENNSGADIVFGFSYDETDDDQVEFATPTGVTLTTAEKDSDYQVGATNWGTVVTYNDEDKDEVTVAYAVEQSDAQVFVTPLTAKVTTTAGGTGVSVYPIAVGMSIMDSEARLGGTTPYIVVGGPCANTVAAELMNNPADCAAGFSEGKAVVKLYSDKNALLVAGYAAKDTQGASRVLADYRTYKDKFTGTELEVVTTSLSNLQVNKVQ